MEMKQISGFTLLELLITVAILGIVTAIAVPSMGTYIKNDRLTTQINTLVSHLAYARSEAVKRSQSVVLCASTSASTCTGGNWEDGWILFVDTNSDNAPNGEEDVLRQRGALDGGNTLASNIGNLVIYDSRGFAPNSSGEFNLCDDRNEGRSISISNTGRVRKADSSC